MDFNQNLHGGGGVSMRRSISRSVSRASRNFEDVFSAGGSRRTQSVNDDEEALKWAAIEKLPTYNRLRTTLMSAVVEDDVYGNQILSKEVEQNILSYKHPPLECGKEVSQYPLFQTSI
ncbi:unnamed protein product [Cochlearia groenlandica]